MKKMLLTKNAFKIEVLAKCFEWPEKKYTSKQYLVWTPFALKTALVLLGTFEQFLKELDQEVVPNILQN